MRRNDYTEQDDRPSHNCDRHRMPDAPQRTDQRRRSKFALAAYDRGDSDDVIGIGRMAHPEKEAQCDERKQRDHVRGSPLILVWLLLYAATRMMQQYPARSGASIALNPGHKDWRNAISASRSARDRLLKAW